MANEILGFKSYLTMQRESTWGEIIEGSGTGAGSGSSGWVHVPVTSYTVVNQVQRRAATPFLGIKQKKHGTPFKGNPAGQMTIPFYGFKPDGLSGQSLAEWLMDWAFENHESQDLPSNSAIWAEGPNVANKRHLGLRVNTATLQGNAQSGMVDFSFDLIGREEEGNAAVPAAMQLPTNRNKLYDAQFADCSFQLGGSAIALSAFNVTVSHGLIAHWNNNYTPDLLVSPTRDVTVSMTPVKNSDTYDTVRRVLNQGTEYVGEIIVTALHNGTLSNTYARMTMALPRLQYVNHQDQGGYEQLTLQNLQFVALKPDTSETDLSLTWDTV